MAAKKKAATERKTRVSTVPADETKRAKFIRLANVRVNAAIKRINQIGNLSGSAYEYGEADISKLRASLTDAVVSTLAKFSPRKADAPAVTFGD